MQIQHRKKPGLNNLARPGGDEWEEEINTGLSAIFNPMIIFMISNYV